MKNIEKYEKELKALGTYFRVTREGLLKKCDGKCEYCVFNTSGCTIKRIEWLLEEYKEPILDDIEKEYLSAVIKPFRKRIKSIKKAYNSGNSAYISIAMNKGEHIFLPYFNLNSGMYKRMEIDKEYTLKDLGL